VIRQIQVTTNSLICWSQTS